MARGAGRPAAAVAEAESDESERMVELDDEPDAE